MRLLYVTQYLARNDEPGANRQWELLQALAARGHHVDVIISGQHFLDKSSRRAVPRREAWAGGTLHRLGGLRGYRRSLYRRALNYLVFATQAAVLALGLRGYDCILASTPSPFVGIVGWIAGVRNRARLWIEVRDVWPEAAVETGLIRSRTIIGMCRGLNAFIYRRADRIVAITPGIRRHLESSYGLPGDRIEVIPNGWSREVFEHPGSCPDLEALGMRAGVFKVIYTGSFGVGNNDIPTILEAARLLRDDSSIQFVFVGDGERRSEIISWQREHGLDNILLVGIQPKNVIPHFLAASDACVLTLPPGEFFEIYLQNKIFDYLGSGRPVLAAVAGDQEELVRACEGGIVVQPGDATALAGAILSLQGNVVERREMGRRAHDYVARYYDRRRLIDHYIETLEVAPA